MRSASTLRARFLHHAVATPNALCVKVVFKDRPAVAWTYSDLFARAAAQAESYRAQGVKLGDKIIFSLNHGPEFLSAYWGAILLGAVPSVFTPPSPKIPEPVYLSSLQQLLNLIDARFIVTDEAYCEPFAGFQRLRVTGEETQETAPALAPESLLPENPAILQFSSGTTGLKKGVVLSHERVLNQLDAYGGAIGLNPKDVIVSWLPLYHDMGLIAGFLLPILSGVPLVLISPFEWIETPSLLLRAISENSGTLTWMPNFAYCFLANRIDATTLAEFDLRSMRSFINCSEAVLDSSHRRFLERFQPAGISERQLGSCYAMAETTFAVTQSTVGEAPRVHVTNAQVFLTEHRAETARETTAETKTHVSSGRVLPGTQVRILGTKGERLPDGTVGEVEVESDSLFSGYLNQPSLTAEVLSDGRYRTGDLGYLHQNELYVVGRKKDLIIIAGKNLHPEDVEATVSSIAGVYPGRVAAVGRTNETVGTEELIILAETTLTEKTERTRLTANISRAIRETFTVAPQRVLLLAHGTLLKSSSGKISRQANLARLDRGELKF